MTVSKKKNTLLINAAFVAVIIGILAFLLRAPEVTTPRLPHDDDHEHFFAMKKKAAGKLCVECHTPEGVYPLPEDHPPKLRCLFCHRRD